MRLLVTGDRNWRESKVIRRALDDFLFFDEIGHEHTLISGDARGADMFADAIGQLMGFNVERYPADWSVGPSGGPERNQRMLDSGVDYVIGFHDNIEYSRGTKDMLRRCARAGIPGNLYKLNGEEVQNWQRLVTR